MEKLFIQNRDGKRITVLLDLVETHQGLAFVAHGLGGFKEQPHIQAFADAFKESGYSVVRWDAIHTLGESEGSFEDATVTNYFEDLEDVINWAKTQMWYQEPFALCGHSIGGMAVALYAEKYPEQVKGLAQISTMVSGALSLQEHHKSDKKEELEEWRRTGILIKESTSKPGTYKRLKWHHMEDRMRYDLIPAADALRMPVLFIVGEHDTGTPPEHQKILYDAIPHDNKELHIINGAEHTFRSPAHLEEVKTILKNWIQTRLS